MVSTGGRLGPYEILSRIGAGGMGEVYKARDTRLDRTVAIKILPASLKTDPAARQRFEREARAIAALQHPHVCTLHDIGHESGTDFLVMEYLSGETLAERLQKGRLSIQQAIGYAIEIAEGLACAHRAGIVHRDLKPGNVVLTKSGAKLLDFGLAKPHTPVASEAPTAMTSVGPITGTGVVLGTVHYMAPEQVEGKEADARTDIFAFGAVLYEMLAGRRPFQGEGAAAIATAILTRDPAPLESVAPGAPIVVSELVRACLAKNPDDRWQSAADLARTLRWETPASRPVPKRPLWKTMAVGAITGLAAAAIGVVVWTARHSDSTIVSTPPARFEIRIPANQRVLDPPVISADGKRVAYAAMDANGRTAVYVRALDELETKQLAGTEHARYPFFAPDGQTIGFFGDGALKIVSLIEGTVTNLAGGLGRYPGVAMGASWGADGSIAFAPLRFAPLQRIVARGGNAAPLTTLPPNSGEGTHRWPEQLPEGRGVLFTTNSQNTLEPFKICLQRPGESAHRDVIDGARNARYVGGHLIFARGNALLAVPFDLASQQITGTPRPVLEGVLRRREAANSYFAVSTAGTLVYAEGADLDGLSTPATVDTSGAERVLRNVPDALFLDPTISPDGSQAIISTFQDASQDLWLYDFGRETWTRLTRSVQPRMAPVWLDGESYVFSANTAGQVDLWRGKADGSSDPDLLVRSAHAKYAVSWSRTARLLAYVEMAGGTTEEDIWLVDLSGPPKPEPFLATRAREGSPDLSLDGGWLAYESDESGRNEVYVRPARQPGGKYQISMTGGRWPRWSRDGKRLFYVDGNRLMKVEVSAASTGFRAGQPTVRLQYPYYGGSNPNYATLPDDGLLIMKSRPQPAQINRFIVVQDWLRRIEGSGDGRRAGQ